MIRLVYTSSATSILSTEDILTLLKECRSYNSKHNITGVLIYFQNTFFQVLEGEESDIEKLYEAIRNDSRHNEIYILDKKRIDQRDFPYWNMGFQKLSKQEIENLLGNDRWNNLAFNPKTLKNKQGIVTPIISLLKDKLMHQVSESYEELPMKDIDPFLRVLHVMIHLSIKALALLMVAVIILGVIDVIYVIYEKLSMQPYFMLTMEDMLGTFGAFIAVLIAIEIFINITIYVRSDVFPVKLVVATALMAISRKVIIFDFNNLSPTYVAASSLVIFSLGVTYYLIDKKDFKDSK